MSRVLVVGIGTTHWVGVIVGVIGVPDQIGVAIVLAASLAAAAVQILHAVCDKGKVAER